MKLDVLLLGVMFHAPASGYELKKYLDTGGRFLRSNTTMSQVYRTLATMEERGWVVHEVEQRPGGSDVKRYSITEEGVAALGDWLAAPYNPPSRFQDPDLIARLSFAGHLSREDLLRIVDTEIETRLAEVARYRHRDRPSARPHPGYDADLGNAVNDWLHRHAAADMDRHIASVIDLRARLLDGRSLTDEPAETHMKEDHR
jgi:PadR family transcriptional regulator, regulatory protein AphA